MGRAPCCEKVGIKKGRWTDEEDEILMKYILANGEGSWRSLPKNAGLSRCGKSCRLRWINYLRSDLKRGSISPEEEEIIIRLHSTLGNRWSLIAAQLPGRTDNEIKNYWNSHLSRKIQSFRKSIGSEPDSQMIMNTPLPRKRRAGRTSRAAMKKTKSYTCRNLNGPIPTTVSADHSGSFNSTNDNTASNTIYFKCTALPIAPAGAATLESLTLSSGKYMYSPHQGNIEVRDLDEGEPQNFMFGGHNQEVGLAPETGTMSFCNSDIMVGPNGLDPQGVVLTSDEDNGVKQSGKMANRSEDLESGVTTSSYADEERFDWEWEGAGVADWCDHDHLWSNGYQTDQMLSWMWDSDEIDAEYPNFAGDTDSQRQEALVAWLLS